MKNRIPVDSLVDSPVESPTAGPTPLPMPRPNRHARRRRASLARKGVDIKDTSPNAPEPAPNPLNPVFKATAERVLKAITEDGTYLGLLSVFTNCYAVAVLDQMDRKQAEQTVSLLQHGEMGAGLIGVVVSILKDEQIRVAYNQHKARTRDMALVLDIIEKKLKEKPNDPVSGTNPLDAGPGPSTSN
jgi:hypothetical protein